MFQWECMQRFISLMNKQWQQYRDRKTWLIIQITNVTASIIMNSFEYGIDRTIWYLLQSQHLPQFT